MVDMTRDLNLVVPGLGPIMAQLSSPIAPPGGGDNVTPATTSTVGPTGAAGVDGTGTTGPTGPATPDGGVLGVTQDGGATGPSPVPGGGVQGVSQDGGPTPSDGSVAGDSAGSGGSAPVTASLGGGEALPFTGFAAGAVASIGALAAAAGVVLRRATRSRTR